MDNGGPSKADLRVEEYRMKHPQIIHQCMDEFTLANWCLWAFDKGKTEMTKSKFIDSFKDRYKQS